MLPHTWRDPFVASALPGAALQKRNHEHPSGIRTDDGQLGTMYRSFQHQRSPFRNRSVVSAISGNMEAKPGPEWWSARWRWPSWYQTTLLSKHQLDLYAFSFARLSAAAYSEDQKRGHLFTPEHSRWNVVSEPMLSSSSLLHVTGRSFERPTSVSNSWSGDLLA